MKSLLYASVFASMLAIGSAAVADTIRVPEDYATIQEAVDAAESGDVILVTPGTYDESVEITTSDITLKSDDDGESRAVLEGPVDDAGIPTTANAIQVVGVSGVTIEGFVIRHYRKGILFENVTSSQVCNNEISQIRVEPNQPFGILVTSNAIELRGSSFNTIKENTVSNIMHDGVVLVVGSNENLVRENHISVSLFPAPVHVGCGVEIGRMSNNNFVEENEIVDYDFGILVARTGGGSFGNQIKENEIHGCKRSGIIIQEPSSGNTIEENDATGNVTRPDIVLEANRFDLVDVLPINNTWTDNEGTSNF